MPRLTEDMLVDLDEPGAEPPRRMDANSPFKLATGASALGKGSSDQFEDPEEAWLPTDVTLGGEL